jgi:ADP-ribosylglycohydrolase
MANYDSIVNSMIWAAYGDAFGFITELCDNKGLKHRTYGKDFVTKLIPWRRKLGGKYGVSIKIPEGCYSDDTQLRLSVCRSIKKDGKFDYETFSKIEVPVFLVYGLGVGRGTRTAGESLQKKSIQWNTNFFDTNVSSYLNAGGNGAAMRIQPHVWVSTEKTSDHELISEILRNSIITHGHPIGWVGAVFHGFSLQYALREGHSPEPEQWLKLCEKTSQIVDVFHKDNALRDIWLPIWEKNSGKKIGTGVADAIKSLESDIIKIHQRFNKNDDLSHKPNTDYYANLYQDSVFAINASKPEVRGSATKTALLATLIGYLFSKNPVSGIEICANTLESDTDTIGTMAGALLGSCCQKKPPQNVMDQGYMIAQAKRLHDIKCGKLVSQFGYPDLLNWDPPKSKLDFIGAYEEGLAICGLGKVKPYGEMVTQKSGKTDIQWRFATTTYGQTLLLKFRDKLPTIPTKNMPTLPITGKYSPGLKSERVSPLKTLDSSPRQQAQPHLPFRRESIDKITDNLIKNGFNEKEIGKQLLRLAEDEDGVDRAIAFASIIVKAKKARRKRNSS